MTDEREMLDVGVTLTLRGIVGITRQFLSERTSHPHDGEKLAEVATNYLEETDSETLFKLLLESGHPIRSQIDVTAIQTRPHELFRLQIKDEEESGTSTEDTSSKLADGAGQGREM